MRVRSVSRRLVQIAALVGTLLVAVVAVLLIASQTPWVRAWLERTIESQAAGYLRGNLTVDRVGGNLLTGVALHGVMLEQDGRDVLRADSIEVEYQPLRFLSGDLALGTVTVTEPLVHLRRTEDGLNLAQLTEPRTPDAAPDPARPSPLLAIDAIDIVDGTITIGERVETLDAVTLPDRVTGLDARVALWRPPGPGTLTVDIQHASFRTMDPSLLVAGLEGRLTVGGGRLLLDGITLNTADSHLVVDGTIAFGARDEVDLDVRSENLALAEFAPFVPALQSRALSPTFAISAEGPLSDLKVDVDLQTTKGDIRADLSVDATAPQRSVEGTFSVSDLNLAAVGGALESSDITATGRVDLAFDSAAGLSGEYEIEAPDLTYGRYDATDVSARGRISGRELAIDAQASAYGGDLAAEGTITLPADGGAVAYELRGSAASVDVDQAARDLNLPDVEAAAAAAGAAPASFEFKVTGGPSGMQTDLRLSELSFAGATFGKGTSVEIGRRNGRLRYAMDGRVRNLDLSVLGAHLGIAALTSPRYASAIEAAVDVKGAGTSLESLTLAGEVTLTDSRLFGGRIPRLRVRSDIVGGSGPIAIEGRFVSVEPGLLSGTDLAGTLSGTVDVRAAVSDLGEEDFSFDNIDAAGTVTLSDSSIAGIPIDTAVFAGGFQDRIARLADVEVNGPDLVVRLSGELALDRRHESDLSYYIDTPPLSEVELITRPVHGELVLQGHVTGSLQDLRVNGTLSGVDVGYEDTSALGIHSQYDVTIPDLTPSRAGGSADTELTSLSIAGRTLTEVRATTTYHAGTIGFDSQVQEAGRSLDTKGRLVWHADHQEVHLDTLRLRSGAAEWQLAANTTAALRYGEDRLVIDDLALLGGNDGRILVDGAIGRGAAMPLRLDVTGLDLAEVDSLLLGQRGLAGQADVHALLRGALAAPTIEGRFTITSGAFENFAFERFAGDFTYGSRAATVDARLAAADGSWFLADGRVPLAEGGALDLRLQSSSIALGIVQGFTDEVTDVRGTVQVDVRATGTYDDPHFEGYADIDGGAFTAVAAGTHFTGLDTRIRFDRDVVRIEQFRILDDEGHPLNIGGELAFRERQVAGLEIRLESRNFEVMDNPLGEIEVNTDLRVTGEPLRLRIDGQVGLASGTVHVDRILDLSDSPYDVQAASHQATTSEPAFGTLAANVRVVIPDNLVLQGTDIQAPGGNVPTGLGDLNLTIGGDLRVRKDPEEPFELIGDVRPIRGTYEFQGREFEIQREGAIVFVGSTDINPTLDVLATRLISGVEAQVHITGTLDAPELELSSRPPLDDADILSLIVFNRPINQLGTGQQISLAQRAASVAAGFIGSQLAETIGEALELDVFDIEVGGALAPSVVLGEQFARDLYLRFRQQLGGNAASSVLLEYEVTDWLRLRSEVSQSQSPTRSLFDRSERGAVKLVFTFRH